MLFKIVLFLILAYLVVRAVRNLLRAIVTDGAPPEPPPSVPRWEGPAPRVPPRRSRDVEDARWKDVK